MKAYFICKKGCCEGVSVVADSEEEAVELTEGELMDMYGVEDISELELEVRELNANVDGLEKGIVGCVEGLKRDIYSMCFDSDEPCPICGDYGVDIFKDVVDGEVIIACAGCLDKIRALVSKGRSVDEAIRIIKKTGS